VGRRQSSRQLGPFSSLDHFRLNHFVRRQIQLDTGITVDVEIQTEDNNGSTIYRIHQIMPSSDAENGDYGFI
jgi:hypothetical protein